MIFQQKIINHGHSLLCGIIAMSLSNAFGKGYLRYTWQGSALSCSALLKADLRSVANAAPLSYKFNKTNVI